MTIVSCPKCREQVLAPAAAEPETTVRCPLCRETYSLADALANLPPALIVVEDEPELVTHSVDRLGEETDGVSDLPFPTLNDFDEDAFPSGESGEVSAFQFETSPPPAFRPKRTPKISIERTPRRRRSAFREIVKIAAGGVVGLVIGQVILWWGLSRDPLQMGPKVSRLAPWAVPPDFHGAAASGTGMSGAGTLASSDLARPTTGRGPSLGDQLRMAASERAVEQSSTADELPETDEASATGSESLTAEQTASDDAGSETESEEATVASSNALEESETPSVETLGQPEDHVVPVHDINPVFGDEQDSAILESDAAPTQLTAETGSAEVEMPTDDPAVPDASLTMLGVRGVEEFSAAELMERIDMARLANAAWDSGYGGDSENIRFLAKEFYRSFVGIGELLAAVDAPAGEPDPLRAEVRSLMRELLEDARKVGLVRHVAPQWMDRGGSHRGVLLAGTLLSVQQYGRFHEAEVELSPGRRVTIVSANERADDVLPGTQLLVLGMTLEEPVKNLDGYTGTAEHVVLGGCQIALE